MVRTAACMTPSPLAMEKTAKPWAMGRRNGVFLANSWSMWIGLKSPLNPAKLTMSASVTVRPPRRPLLTDLEVVEVEVERRKAHGGLGWECRGDGRSHRTL